MNMQRTGSFRYDMKITVHISRIYKPNLVSCLSYHLIRRRSPGGVTKDEKEQDCSRVGGSHPVCHLATKTGGLGLFQLLFYYF